MVKNEDDMPIVITGNEARGGLHEHRVHYVLAFGLAGGIIAFVAVGLYFGYDKLTQTISQALIPSDPITLVSYAILIAFAAVGTVLLLGMWQPEYQPEGDALARRAAIHRALPRYGRPLFVR